MSAGRGQFVTLISVFFVVHMNGVLSNCDPLLYREGVQVKCIASQSQKSVDCYKPNIPVGTIARYDCERPYYFPAKDELAETSRTLTCNSRGKWAGGRDKFHLFSCTLNCGVTKLGAFAGFIIGGTETKQAEWPWHAIIFGRPRSDLPFKYICGGSLIKPYGKGFVILTAAHCISDGRGRPRDPSNLKVILGSEESTLDGVDQHSPDAQVFTVKQFILHKSFGGRQSDYQSDIALMRLEQQVILKPNILPSCLSTSTGLPEEGQIGHLVGFGLFNKDSDATSIKPRRASFPVVHSDKCFEWRETRKLLESEYCAGTEDYQNSCDGDSGGGMVFNGTDENGTKRFYLQGIVSHGRVNVNTGEACDTYSVYTKVNRYIDWIYESAEKLFEEDEDESPNIETPSQTTTTARTTTTRYTISTRRTTTTTRAPDYPTYPDVDVIDKKPSVAVPAPSPGGKDYEIAAVERHNHYRRLHGAPDLRLSSQLSQHAQSNAEKQIREGTFVNNYEPGINKNIYKLIRRIVSGPEAVRKAIDSWYSDVASYNWNNPSYSTFSQVVWKRTTEIGVGVAISRDGNEQMVVVSYTPAGNVAGQFDQNVSPKQ